MMVLAAKLILLAPTVYCGLSLMRGTLHDDEGDCARITRAGCHVIGLMLSVALGVSL